MQTIKSNKQNSASKTLLTTTENKGHIIVTAEIQEVFNNKIN
jgi:hypothetical protein